MTLFKDDPAFKEMPEQGPKRGKHYVQPRGYISPPGTGPEGETCGTCAHCRRFKQSKSWIKCGLNEARWTGGSATDILSRSPACKQWQPQKDNPRPLTRA